MIATLTALFVVCSCGGQQEGPSLRPPLANPTFELPERVALITLPRGAEWEAVANEAAALLSAYLKINTANPPGNELESARFLRAVLEREGIETRLFEPARGKANLYARLIGQGGARPVILLSHMDVVLASPEHWSVDPFGGIIRDGAVWGRGALDMKGMAVVQLMTVVLLKRAGVPLKRDVIFLATADEEVGVGVGAGWFVERHRDLIDNAEFLINEGGTIRADGSGRILYHGVGVTEKSPFWLNVTAHGTAGHGSRPLRDNAVERLVRALGRIAAWKTPLSVVPTMELHFRALSERAADPKLRQWYADIRTALQDSAAVRRITSSVNYNALLRNTISITGLSGSDKTNVIPPTASAVLDVRLLPGEDPESFLDELRRVVDDPQIEFTPQGVNWPATESPVGNELYRAIEATARRFDSDVPVVPSMLAGFTDSHHFRPLGIASYGVSPFPLTEDEARGVHGNDERLPLRALRYGVEYFFQLIYQLVRQ